MVMIAVMLRYRNEPGRLISLGTETSASSRFSFGLNKNAGSPDEVSCMDLKRPCIWSLILIPQVASHLIYHISRQKAC